MGHSIAFSAGEASGDLNGARLAQELLALRPQLRLWGAGGRRMREAGVEMALDMSGSGSIGIAASVKAAPQILARYLRLRSLLLSRKPDLFVPIDFGAFNTRLAQIARKNCIPVVYYFPPSSWRRRPTNAPRLRACGGKVITPFPWSAQALCAQGVDARFVGHPLIDIVRPSVERDQFLRELDCSDCVPLIGLLPGSRSHEIAEHVGPMLECARIVHRELGRAQFVVGAAWGSADRIRARIERAWGRKQDCPPMRVLEGRAYDCIAHARLLITASGTATLEAGIAGTPMVIVYRGSALMRLEYRLRRSELEEHIGMPNIILGRQVCPELVNEDVTAGRLADATLRLLRDEEALARMRAELAEMRAQLGEPGAARRAAQALLEMGGLA